MCVSVGVCLCVWRLASCCGYSDVVCSVRICPCRPVASAVVRQTCVLVGANSRETNALNHFNLKLLKKHQEIIPHCIFHQQTAHLPRNSPPHVTVTS